MRKVWISIQSMRKMNLDIIWMKLMIMGAKFGCHQRADRSYYVGYYQFPLCARCMGILISTIIAYVTFPKRRVNNRECVFMMIPLAVDGILQYLRICESNNNRRLLTGLLWGFGCTYIRLNIFKYLMNKFLSA